MGMRTLDTLHSDNLNCIVSKTAEHLTLKSLAPGPDDPNGGDRSKSVFKEDEAIPLPFRALLKDYFRSGYDRGHM